MELPIRSCVFKRYITCIFLVSGWNSFPGILGQGAVVSGPTVSNACYGSDGVDLSYNQIKCSSGERVCIQNVNYGIKKPIQDISCPYAIGFSVPKICCSPRLGDCLVVADPNKLTQLREDCYYESPSGCALRADRINMQSSCMGSNFVVRDSTFRSITYSCVPESLIKLSEDHCLLVPEAPNVTEIVNATDELIQPSTTSTTTQPKIISPSPVTDSGTASVLIGAIVGGSLFLMACLVLILLAITLRRRKTKREAIASKDKFSGTGDACAETGKHPNGIPYGHSPFYGKSRGFNVYVPCTKEDFKLMKTRPVIGVNVSKPSHKKYSRNVSHTSDGSNVSEETTPKVTRSPPPGYRSRASSNGSRVHSTKSSPPDYRSRASSRGNRVHSEVSHDRTVSFEVPEEKTLPTREYTGEWKKLTDSLDDLPVHRF